MVFKKRMFNGSSCLMADKLKCSREFSLYFVAFDLEEVQDCCPGAENCTCRGALCGSGFFVRNFTKYLNDTGATFQGAVIMDTVMNYNKSENSQKLPPGFNQGFPVVHKRMEQNKFRGDFLTAVGRQSDDKKLRSIFKEIYKRDGN